MNEQRSAFCKQYENFRVDVPEGKDGLYEIRRREMSERDAYVSSAMGLVTKTDRLVKAGVYTQLVRYGYNDETIVMSDHLPEVADHEPLVTYAQEHAPLNHVLINGLGIGVAIELLTPYVEQFTIVELSISVIRLVAPHYQSRYPGRVEVVHHNALTYRPPKGVRYNAVFHDIWDFISPNNLADMRLLHRRYGRICDWQGSWARNYCERQERKRKQNPEEYANRVDVKDVMKSLNTLFAITEDVQHGEV